MKTYPLFRVHVDEEAALEGIRQVFRSGYINEGEQVTRLTKELSIVLAARNLSLVNSCTSALTLALRVSGVGPDTDVVSTPMTCVATNAAIASLGARIVWADVDPTHGMLDAADVARKITQKTKAVVAVAWAGTPPDMLALNKACAARDVVLVLDAAHAFGAEYRGTPVHDWADFTTYSFQAIKHFTTGDGGALICALGGDHERAKALKWFGLDRDRTKDAKGDWKGQQWDVDIDEVGYKFNMNNVAASIGLSQLPHVDRILGVHRCNAATYDDLFRGFGAVVPCRRVEGALSSQWVYSMQVDPNVSRLSRDDLLKALNAEAIMAGVVHVRNDAYTCFKSSVAGPLPGVDAFSANQLALPCGWWMTDDDVRHVARRVKELTQ